MRQVIKDSNSLARDLVYNPSNQGGVNDSIRSTLLQEQSNICAYTEYYLDRGSSKPIEHFNPTLKGKSGDGYHNYFICRDQWNMEKGKPARWSQFQPLLHPTISSFNEQVKYKDGIFIADDDNMEAKNLIDYLKLNDLELVKDRNNYIKRKRFEFDNLNETPNNYFEKLLNDHPESIYFIRSIEEEFDLNVDLKNKKITQKK